MLLELINYFKEREQGTAVDVAAAFNIPPSQARFLLEQLLTHKKIEPLQCGGCSGCSASSNPVYVLVGSQAGSSAKANCSSKTKVFS
ncbi:FeoC-like transcriptional regulator [Flexibacterium corallicola]|uniref:FeoC-like transcriptional regulator n=1 Tax=Flexibacterium corallicola TaxID=3037259 RepID=UPI00286EB883|nr:FeoC-like transcriptional regulator [Pseudovibrio sp. M1P-2-3]